ncbi:MAG: hypothetical protein CMF50_05505 [Legionellales bacterium]|nr:hypothetical protein [Legionellales bacterium]|tara:strand:- start:16548 stop:16829 length:282 start_codon:yes stop_codon:yes gene_type:complete
MFDPKVFDDIAKKLTDALPPGLKDAKQDMENNFRSILQSCFAKLDLVTREEFDTQAAVLAKTRQKLEQLEVEVKKIEAISHKKPAPKKKSEPK